MKFDTTIAKGKKKKKEKASKVKLGLIGYKLGYNIYIMLQYIFDNPNRLNQNFLLDRSDTPKIRIIEDQNLPTNLAMKCIVITQNSTGMPKQN